MEHELDLLESSLDLPDRTSPAVSRWSIRQQQEHAATAARMMADAIRDLNGGGGEPGGRPKLIAHLMFLTGWIPRGKGKAPETVLPGDAPDVDRIRESIADARAILREAGPPGAGNRIDHPILGRFTARQWHRFGAIHTLHHLKIVEDILGGSIRFGRVRRSQAIGRTTPGRFSDVRRRPRR